MEVVSNINTNYAHDVSISADTPNVLYIADYTGVLLYDVQDKTLPQMISSAEFRIYEEEILVIDVKENQIFGGVGHWDFFEDLLPSYGIVVFTTDTGFHSNDETFSYFCSETQVRLTGSTYCENNSVEFEVEKEGYCNDRGTCIFGDAKQRCNCSESYMGDNCETWQCSLIDFKSVGSVCSGHGLCESPNNCSCSDNYEGGDCEVSLLWYCGGVSRFDEENVCSGRGNCSSHDSCDCVGGYDEESFCSTWECFGYGSSHLDVCSGNGQCISPHNCSCDEYYTGENCDISLMWFCAGISRTDTENVCSGRGDCVSEDNCECHEKEIYEGDTCSSWSCYGYNNENEASEVCSGNGDCVEPDVCECKGTYIGEECQVSSLYFSVLIPLVSASSVFSVGLLCLISTACVCLCLCCFCSLVLLLCASCCVLLRQCLRLSRFGKLKNFDMLLKEQKLEEDPNVAKIRFNKSLFEVDMDDIKIISILGEGGSSSVVYKGIYKGSMVAFKCFKTRLLVSAHDDFSEFEKEVEILSSVGHPNIIRFLGAALKPPRVGIIMEFCPNGELLEFVRDYRVKHHMSYPMIQKIRLLTETTNAVSYLHSKNIIHRDIKCENVLISEDDHAKLMDFGLSRCVKSMSKQQKTMRIGTSHFMSPEIVLNSNYTEKTDVYSLAVMFYVLIDERTNPFDDITDDYNVEIKVANDPNFRPSFEHIMTPDKLGDDFLWMKDLIETCWNHDPGKRFSCEKIGEILSEKGSLEAFKKIHLDDKKDVEKKVDVGDGSNVEVVGADDEEALQGDEDLEGLLMERVEELENLCGEKDKIIESLQNRLQNVCQDVGFEGPEEKLQ